MAAAPVRVMVDDRYARGNSMEFLVVTGSLEQPVACFADNNGYPQVHALYARPGQAENPEHKGVRVTVVFDGPARGNGLAINIWQPDMVGDYTVLPA